MESIKEWVSYNKGPGYGDGGGDSAGHCYSDGSGYGYGDTAGSGVLFGFGCGDGSGRNTGSGYGDSSYSGYGLGKGPGVGTSYASGSCCDTNLGIVRINGQEVYDIDGVDTVILKIKGNVAHGGVVQDDLSLVSCYVVRGEGYYAHGKTLAEAREALMEKILEGKSEEERIADFVKHFPKGAAKKGTEYYEWHHILTGSCKMGRNNFVKSRGLDLSKEYTPDEFIQLTKGSYGKNIIKKLEEVYAQQERS